MGSFVAVDFSALTSSVNSLTDVVWPSHAAGTIALTGHASLNTETATLDAAFTTILNTTDTNLRGLFGKRTAASMTGSESGAIAMASNPTANRQVGSVLVLSGYSDVQQVVSLGEPSTTPVSSHACPTITPQVAGSGFVMWYMDRVGTGTTTMTPPAGFTKAGEFGTSGSGGTYQCVSYDLSGTHGLTPFTPANWSGAVASTSALVVIAELIPSVLTVNAALALETDAALSLAASKLLSGGLAAETDAAFAVAVSKLFTAAVASETDAARAAVASKAGTFGKAAETDTALPGATSKAAVLGLPTETDTALAATVSRAATIAGLATETDGALAATVTKAVQLGTATETGAAIAASSTGDTRIGAGLATETDDALAATVTKQLALGIANETSAAQSATVSKTATLAAATETDTALALIVSGQTRVDAGLADETDTALAAAGSKTTRLATADETGTALAVTISKTITLQLAAEIDEALAAITGEPSPAVPGQLVASHSGPLLVASNQPSSRLEASHEL